MHPKGGNMHTYDVYYSFRGPKHEDGCASFVKATDSYQAAQIVERKFPGRDITIVRIKQRD